MINLAVYVSVLFFPEACNGVMITDYSNVCNKTYMSQAQFHNLHKLAVTIL